MDRVVVGITGASGIPYGIRLLEVLKEFDVELHLTCSPSASLVNKHEGDGRSWKDVLALADVVHDNSNLAASISSGSFKAKAMAIVPCSGTTLGKLAAGISADVEADDKIFDLVKARLPWLFLGLLGGLGSVFILQDFETIMEQPTIRNLFFYTPLIAAMAGNVGVQSSAIIVQGIANDVVKGSLFNRLVKEIGLSLINGFSLAIIILIFGQIIDQSFLVSATIAGSMILVIVVAALVGTFVPIILNKRGIDPAIATGPFITTANDIFGIFLFFSVAKLILGF